MVFAANPNVLYLQSTPMSEMLLIACISGTVYHLMRWCQTGAYRQLAATGAAMLLGSVTRYEAWVVDVAVVAAVVWVAWRRRPRAGLPDRLTRAQADLVFYGTLAFSGILAWVLWNQVIFHDALYFQTGAFAKPSLWVSRQELAIGHPRVAGLTYLYAMADNMGWLALALAMVGLACYLVRSRHRADAVAPLTVLIVIPFYIYALYSGQRPLHVMQLNGSLYNVRFGVLAIIPVALFVGYLAAIIQDQTRRRVRAAGYAALGAAAAAVGGPRLRRGHRHAHRSTGVPGLRHAARRRPGRDVVPRPLRRGPGADGILRQRDRDLRLAHPARLGPLRGQLPPWSPALRDPAGHGIRWIYMRRTPGDPDQVWRLLHGHPELAHYALVYSDPDRLIYAYRGAARRGARPPDRKGTVMTQLETRPGQAIAPLPEHLTAQRLLSRAQAVTLAVLASCALVIAAVWLAAGAGPSPLWWAQAAVATVIVVYLLVIGFKTVLILSAGGASIVRFGPAGGHQVPDDEMPGIHGPGPAVPGGAGPAGAGAQARPAGLSGRSTQVLLLVEADDEDTRRALGAMSLGPPFEVVLMPPGQPRHQAEGLQRGPGPGPW